MWLLTFQITFSTVILVVTTSADTNKPRVLNSKDWNYPYTPSQLLVQCCAYHCKNGRSQFDDCECSRCTPRPQYYRDKHGSLVKVLYSDDHQGQGNSIRQLEHQRIIETDNEKPLDPEDYVLIILITVIIPTAIVLLCFLVCILAIWKKYRPPDVNANSESKEKPCWTATGIAGGKRFKTFASASPANNAKMADVQDEEVGLESHQIGRVDDAGASGYDTEVVGRPPRSARVTANSNTNSEAVCLEVVEFGPGNRTFRSRVVLPIPPQEPLVNPPDVMEGLAVVSPQPMRVPPVVKHLPPTYDEVTLRDIIPPTYNSLSRKRTS